VKLDAAIAASLPFGEALNRLESRRGELLPANIGKRAARAAGPEYVASIRSRLTDGLPLLPAEIVFAHRQGSGTRPVADLSVDARVVIEAFSIEIGQRLSADAEMLGLVEHITGAEPGQRVEVDQRPLDDPAVTHIVKADVASFYEYVDHELLSREIVELAADVDLAYATSAFLAEITGRRYGLPQGPQGSDILASIYLSAVDRRLIRAGVRLERVNDDYLLRCGSLGEARRHLLALEMELRSVGLILNHQKTQIMSREKYAEGLTAFQEMLAEAAIESVEVPFGYGFDPDQFADINLEDADQSTVESAFVTALDDAERPFEVRRRMIDGALPFLAGFQSAVPAERLDDLVATFPSQIRNANLYLRSLIGTGDEQTAISAAVGVLGSTIAPVPWVQGWLVDVLARATSSDPEMIPWLRAKSADPAAPWFLRTRALIAVAHSDHLPAQEELATLFHSAPDANRPDIVAAVAMSTAEWRNTFLGSLGANDPVLRQVTTVLDVETPLTAL
jgi:hypothetical protein